MPRRTITRAGLVFGGFLGGVLLLLVLFYGYLRLAAEGGIAAAIDRAIDLPPEVLRIERIEGDTVAVVVARDVEFSDRAGARIAWAPLARFSIDLTSLPGDGPLELRDVLLNEPFVNFVQYPDGSTNLEEIFRVTVARREVDVAEAPERGFVIRNLRIAGGEVRWASPYEGEVPADEVRLATIAGTTMRIRTVRDLDAVASLVRVGGVEPWRVQVASASALLTDPELRIVTAAGFAEEAPGDWIRFAIDEFRTERSELTGEGLVRLGETRAEFDVRLEAAPLAFADLRWFVPQLPAEGTAAGEFALVTRDADRTEVRGAGLVVEAFDSRVTGRFAALVGGDLPVSFWDTELHLEPLRLQALAQLGLLEEMPYTGEVRGVVSAPTAEPGTMFALGLDLTATFAPIAEEVPVSTVLVRGPITVGGPDAPVRFDGTELILDPLHLAALRPLAPEQAERLRGTAQGGALVFGTPAELRLEGGDLAYVVGLAPPTRITDLTLQLRTEPTVWFSLDARAAPLALATVSELFPAFPFRTATFGGPIAVEGTPDEFRLDVQLSGAAGLIAVQGVVAPADEMRFDLVGRVAAFDPGAVLDRPLPVSGPMTGTFSAAGVPEDLRFSVDLLQEREFAEEPGTFAAAGTYRQIGDAAFFDVTGTVFEFNIGMLIGRPALLPGPLTGAFEVAGGGPEPYRFDVDLRGPMGLVDLAGWYAPAAIPTYRVVGAVAGLDLRQLPGGEGLPQTRLNAEIEIQGQGTTLETLAGEFQVDATDSTIGGRAVEALRADVIVSGGVATVRTLDAAIEGSRLTAAGTWGLTRPAAEPLSFSLTSPNASRLAPLLPLVDGAPPQVAGAFSMRGSVAGTLTAPVVDVVFQGQNLRYEDWRARELQFGLAATLARPLETVGGELTLVGRDVDLGGRLALQTVRIGADGAGGLIAVRGAADRDERTGVALTGLLELRGAAPGGLLLDSLTVRTAAQPAWELTTPARLQWGGVEGLVISNLNLARAGDEPGLISVDGALPPTGLADLRVVVQNFDLAIVRELDPLSPPMEGVVQLNMVLEGPVDDPELSLIGTVQNLRYLDLQADSVFLTGQYAAGAFVSSASLWRDDTELAQAEAAIPMTLAFAGVVPQFEILREAPLLANLVAEELPLAILAGALPEVSEPAGVISTRMETTGTFNRPVLSGWADVRGGAAVFGELGVRYQDIHGRATFAGQLIQIDSLVARSDGLASLSGTVQLVDLATPELNLAANLQSFHAIRNRDVADLWISGGVQLVGRMPRPVLTGRITLDQGTIFMPYLGQTAPLDLTAIDFDDVLADTALAVVVGPGFVENIRISDLNVTLLDGVWLEAPQARVEIRGELIVFRSGPDLRLYGNLEATRGTYTLLIGPIVREFDVVAGTVRFLGTGQLNPELDITAAHQVRTVQGTGAVSTLNIMVHVTGTAEYPRVALTSDTRPPLPESELLSYLVFGQPSFRLGQQQGFAQQLVVQELLGGLLVQELAQLGVPCDYFRMRGRPTEIAFGSPLAGFGATTLECGVQVFRDVFLTLETGVTSAVNPSDPFNPLLGVSLDWQIRDQLRARIARDPVRTGVGALFQSSEVRYQWSVDLDGRWEFGHPDTLAAPVQAPRPGVPGELLPGGTPPPTAPTLPVSPPPGELSAPARPEEGPASEPVIP